MGNMPNVGAAAQTSMIFGGIGSALGAGSEYLAGIGQAQQYSYQAQVARNNAALARADIGPTLEAGRFAESAQKLKTGQTIAGQRVGYAANGVDVGVGTPQNVAASTQRVGDLDAAMIHYNAAKAAYGLDVEAWNDEQQAGLYDRAAKNSKRAGLSKAAASLISGASSLSGKWANYKLSGAR